MTVTGPGGYSTCSTGVAVISPNPPVCSLFSDSETIIEGGIATLSWETERATKATLDQGIGPVSVPDGSLVLSPTETTTYAMTVQGPGGIDTCQKTITVNPAPPTCSGFLADENPLQEGQSTILRWILGGGTADTAEITANPLPDIGNVFGLTEISSGPRSQTTEFTLTVRNISGYDRCTLVLGVNELVPNLVIDKRVSLDGHNFEENIVVHNGDWAFYELVIQNTGSGSGGASLTDILGNPTNGGSLSIPQNEQNNCSNSGTGCSGSLAGGDFVFRGLPAGETLRVTYQRQASQSGIPSGQSSRIVDTAALSGWGDDTATVSIVASGGGGGPTCSALDAIPNPVNPNQPFTLQWSSGNQASYEIFKDALSIARGNGSGTFFDITTGITTESTYDVRIYSAPDQQGTVASCPLETVTLTQSELFLTKMISENGIDYVTDPLEFSDGETVYYSIIIENKGTAVRNVSLTDFLPGEGSKGGSLEDHSSIPTVVLPSGVCTGDIDAGLNCSLDPNVTATITYAKVVNVNDPTPIPHGEQSEIINTATLFEGNQVVGNDTATVIMNQQAGNTLVITKLLSEDGIIYGEDPLDRSDGEHVYYAIIIENTGLDARTVHISDSLPLSGLNGGSLQPLGNFPTTVEPQILCTGDLENGYDCLLGSGATVSINYGRVVDANNPTAIPHGEKSPITNTASLFENGQLLATDTATVNMSRLPGPGPDLALEIVADDTSVPPSTPQQTTTVNYRVDWKNIGDVPMNNTTVVVTCEPSSALAGLQALGGVVNGNVITYGPFNTDAGFPDTPLSSFGSFSFTADLATGFGDPTPANIDCSAHIESADFPLGQTPPNESDETNNDDNVVVNVNIENADSKSKRVKNLRTGIEGTQIEAFEGDELEYTLSYRAGQRDVTGHVFSDDVSDILQYAEIIDLGGGALDNGTISWSAIDIPAFATENVRFKIRIFDDVENIGGDYKLQNIYGNDVTVVTLPNLTRFKYVEINGGARVTEGIASPGDTLTYTLRVENSGESNKNGFVFADDISDILEYSTVIDFGGGTVEEINGQQVISWNPVTIPALGSEEKIFQVQIDDPLLAGGDYTLRNAFGNAVTVVTLPNVLLSKKVKNQTTDEEGVNIQADAEDILFYTLTANNQQTTDFTFGDGQFFDDISDLLVYADISAISDGGSLNAATGLISWPGFTLSPQQFANRTFIATIKPAVSWPTDGDLTLTNIFGDTVVVNLKNKGVDTHIEKKASVTTIFPEGEVIYTLSYVNQGERNATNVVIVDDFDEGRMTIKNGTLPQGCTFENLNDPLHTIGGPFGIRCLIGDLPVGGTAQNLQYTLVANADATGTLVNTAQISQEQVEQDPSDNQSSASVIIQTGGLSISKSASPSSVKNGTKTTYTVTVSNSSGQTQSFNIQDVLSVGNNGGFLTLDQTSQSIVFTPVGSGSASGILGQGNLRVNSLESGASIRITYDRIGDQKDIPFNQSSQFTNTATIVETGGTASTDVFVVGPTSGGGSSGGSSGGSGGGGGGGGGGGWRRTADAVNLYIQKDVREGNHWETSDDIDFAVLLEEFSSPLALDFRIIVRNEGNINGNNVVIEDLFFSDGLSRLSIDQVEGAEWDPQTQSFMIPRLRSGKSQTITYTASFEQRADATVDELRGENKATIVAALPGEKAPIALTSPSSFRYTDPSVQGIGKSDSAFFRNENEYLTLQKVVDKSAVKMGDVVKYRILVKNRGGFTYNNIVVTDHFPFADLDFVHAAHTSQINPVSGQVTFTKKTFAPGEVWAINITAKAKTVSAKKRVNNIATISAENADLSSIRAEVQTTIIRPFERPPLIVKTGASLESLIPLFLGLAAAITAVRRRRK